jgi:hypothetical protein
MGAPIQASNASQTPSVSVRTFLKGTEKSRIEMSIEDEERPLYADFHGEVRPVKAVNLIKHGDGYLLDVRG